MKNSELQALISLLEDEDPGVKAHVHKKLISLGDQVIPTLETAWEQEDQRVQEQIEEIIYVIQSEQAILALKNWMHSQLPDLLDGWFYLTRYQYPEIEFDNYKGQISRLVNRIWLELRSGMTVPESLMVVNRMLFVRERFRANRKNLNDPQNYFLNGLIDGKKGAPLSLGLLYLILCQELEIQLHGILLPGYFVLVHKQGEEAYYVDVFNKGTLFTKDDLTRFLSEMNVEQEERYYQPASHQQIILEMVRALLLTYRQRRQQDKVEKMQKLLQRLSEDV